MRNFDAVQHAKKIWILDQVVDSGSLKLAALRIKVSPAALSQSLSALEKVVGQPLLIKDAGKMMPTLIANRILRTARPALQELCALGVSSPRTSPEIDWISLGSYESLAVDILPRLAVRLRLRIPKLKLTIRVARTGALAAMVRKGELCAALVTESDCFGRLISVPISEDRLGYYVSAKTSDPDRSWESLFEGPLGTISPGPDGYPRYYTRFVQESAGKFFKPGVLSDSYEAIRALAVSGTMAAILPSRVAERTAGELVEIRPPRTGRARGRHRICLITQQNCDPAEIELLSGELRALFGESPSRPGN